MRRFTTSSAMVVGLACCALFASVAVAGPKEADHAATEMLNLGLRGVYFIPNQGQWSDANVQYGLRSRGLDVAFRESALTMHMTRAANDANESNETTEASPKRERGFLPFDPARDASEANESNEATQASPKRERGGVGDASHEAFLADASGSLGESADFERLTLTITFPGSNVVLPQGAKPQAAKFNYFVGGEGREAASDVPSFGAVVYENLYDGVDLHVMGNDDGVLKYEFHVAPGADWSPIRIAYDGVDSLCIDDGGNLQINTLFGTLADGAPVVYHPRSLTGGYVDGQSRDAIPARFELCDARTYRIALDGPVDPTRELIIDPDVEWMTYLGGSGWDYGYGIAVDSAGNALVMGDTNSTDFEGRNNAYHGGYSDAFVAKVSATGVLQWMTYLGGSGLEEGAGIGVDSAGNSLVTGRTNSTDFEGRNNAYHGGLYDAFVVKISDSGALQWMTYLGGGVDDFGYGIAVDSAGNALVTGWTGSTDFEGRNNAFHGVNDAFVVKVSAAGALQWMTYLGGSSSDFGYGIAVESVGNALVTGSSWSTDFEGRNNAHHGGWDDAFVVKVSASGVLQWMTYLGGSDHDHGHGIAVDGAGDALVAGHTYSPDFEGRNNAHHGDRYDAFGVKVNASGVLQWMTYLGGSGDDLGDGIAVDSAGNALVTGYTQSTDFEGWNNAFHGWYDAFVVKVSASGALQWMTYLGGSRDDRGYGIAVDRTGNTLVTGDTGSTDFEGRNNANHGDVDVFVVKLRIVDGPALSVNASCPNGGPIAVSWSGATPNGRVALIFARNTGDFIVPANYPCQGTQLGLGTNQIQLVGDYGAGATGERTLNGFAGNGACGGYMQLLDLSTCGTSNVARIE